MGKVDTETDRLLAFGDTPPVLNGLSSMQHEEEKRNTQWQRGKTGESEIENSVHTDIQIQTGKVMTVHGAFTSQET